MKHDTKNSFENFFESIYFIFLYIVFGAYLLTATAVMQKLLNSGMPWFQSLKFGAFWPFALVDIIVQSILSVN